MEVCTGNKVQTKKRVLRSSGETERGKCAHHTRFPGEVMLDQSFES